MTAPIDHAAGCAICAAYEAISGRNLPPDAVTIVRRIVADVPDTGQAAYLLATVEHETAGTYDPTIRERHSGPSRAAYFEARYGGGTRLAFSLGNVHPGDGALYYGRGPSQLTGRSNYRRMSEALARYAGLEVNLEAEPDLACDREIAYQILLVGVLKGLFTGVSLRRYVEGEKKDYVNARRVVNGTDKAELIASYAAQWERALASRGV